MERLLEGVRILDLTQALSGPYCCMHLADQGADVIKIEPPGGDMTRIWAPVVNDYSGYYAYFNRNKKGITLDLKSEEGKEALRDLIRKSDVIVENFKAGTFAKLGFTYESIKEINPKIIYAQLTGFGLSGPMSEKPCYDIVAQAESGMMDMCGYPDGDTVKIGPSVADTFTGTYLALAIMMALFRRTITGEGYHVDVAMLDTMFSTLEEGVIYKTLQNIDSTRAGNIHWSSLPWDLYHAEDGSFVIGVGTHRQWVNFCNVLGLEALIDDPRYATFDAREKNYIGDLKDKIEEKSKYFTLDYLEEQFLVNPVPFGRIRSVSECMKNPQIKERNMLWTVYDPGLGTDFTMPGSPIKVEGVPDTIRFAAPRLGEHNQEIFKNILGYDDEKIKKLL